VGYNRTNTSLIPKLFLSLLDELRGHESQPSQGCGHVLTQETIIPKFSGDDTLTRALPGSLTKHEPPAATPGDPGIAGG